MTRFPEISPIATERLVLRGFEARDLPAYVAYRQSPRSAEPTGAMSEAAATERFFGMIGHWAVRGFGRYAITTGAEAPGIGHVGPSQMTEDDAPEMTWTLWDQSQGGRGYATEAARSVLGHLFAQGWGPIAAHIDPGNGPSLAMAKRLGAVGDPNGQRPPHCAGMMRFILTPEALT